MGNSQQNTPPRRSIQSYVFGALLVILFLAVCSILRPFFSALLWSILLYILLRPAHRRVTRGLDSSTLKGRFLRNFLAAAFAIGTIVVILIPLSFVATIFFRQIMDLINYFRGEVEQNPEYLRDIFANFSGMIRDISGGQIELSAPSIESQIKSFLAAEMQRIIQLGSDIVRNIGSFLLGILLVMCSMFFLFIDGSYLGRLVQNAVPIRKDHFAALSAKFMETVRALFRGYIIVALLQAAAAFIIYTIFGVKGALVLAVVTFILVFIPMAGAAILYLPVTVVRIANGDITGGVVLFAVSAIFISGIEQILRPYFLKDKVHLHPLIILLSILGGIIVFGFNGVILGPTLVILFLTVLDLFLTEHKMKRQSPKKEEADKTD